MTSSSPNRSPDGDRPLWVKWVRRAAIGGGVVVLVGVAGTLAARFFVYRQLGPMIENILGGLINRPVEIGPITGFSLSGIQIDGAAIPPTVDDEDYAKVPKVEVGFNPIKVLTNVVRDRTLPITLTFIAPELYLQEDSDKRWVELQLKESTGDEGGFTLGLDTIKATNATLIVAPFPQATYRSPDSDAVPSAAPVVFKAVEAI
ncbi:MAG: hypothetical protein F6K16_42750, partial [Symploca sp. SIO2B6]|nr:hypothetical protein [Symploca sp. SIO2B6]